MWEIEARSRDTSITALRRHLHHKNPSKSYEVLDHVMSLCNAASFYELDGRGRSTAKKLRLRMQIIGGRFFSGRSSYLNSDFKQKHDQRQHQHINCNVTPVKDGNKSSSPAGKAAAVHETGCYYSLCRGLLESTGNSQAEKRGLRSH